MPYTKRGDGEDDRGSGSGAARPRAFSRSPVTNPRRPRVISARARSSRPGLSRLAGCSISCRPIITGERMNRLYALENLSLDVSRAAPIRCRKTLISGAGEFSFPQAEDGEPDQDEDASTPSIRARCNIISAPFAIRRRIHAMCEDYRAGAYADYEIDKADISRRARKITIPDAGAVGRCGALPPPAATPARHLEEMGHQCHRGAGRFRAFSDGGESGT